MIDEVFRRLKIRIAIKLNNRKILAGIAELIGAPEKIVDITVAIDKIDKIGIENVNAELIERGLSEESVGALRPILEIDGTIEERVNSLEKLLEKSEVGSNGVRELRTVVNGIMETGLDARLDIDVSLARGLNYYTGTIIEVKALDVEIGSITGGGRYDNLTGVFGLPGVSGVGISFGADRIYDVLNTLNLYPEGIEHCVQVMFTNFGEKEAACALRIIKKMRDCGIQCEIYPDTAKMQKQMKYADSLGTPYVAIIGETEMSQNRITLKNMSTGEQQMLTEEEAIAIINPATSI